MRKTFSVITATSIVLNMLIGCTGLGSAASSQASSSIVSQEVSSTMTSSQSVYSQPISSPPVSSSVTSTTAVSQGKQITENDAKNIVKQKIGDDNGQRFFNVDHVATINGVVYYVIQAYEVWNTPDSSNPMSDTYGWYYVNQSTGQVYKFNLDNSSLTPLQ